MIIIVIGISAIIFFALYLSTFYDGFFYSYRPIICSVICAVISVLSVFTVAASGKNTVYKISVLSCLFFALTAIAVYFIKRSGISEHMTSVDDIREYVRSFGRYAVFPFIVLQFLQVTVLPVPGVLTVGAGVLLFGAFHGAVYSLIGILLGSFAAFFIGRVLGYRAVRWLVGEQTLQKTLNKIKGKDKILLSFMFLFPFFPDDVLCFVSGLSSMSAKYFAVVITLTRALSVFATSYSVNNSIIPYTTWWGLLIWAALIISVSLCAFAVFRKGDKIASFFQKRSE